MNPSKYNKFIVPQQSNKLTNTKANMVIFTYAPRVQCTMKYASKTKTQTQITTKNSKTSKKKNKGKNRSKEVHGWNDIPGYGAPKAQEERQAKSQEKRQEKRAIQYGKWVCGTIPMETIKKMKWGDIDELTDEEYGYFQDVPVNIN